MSNDQSLITIRPDGTASSYIGPDAVEYFRVRVLRGGIRLYRQTGIVPTRGMTISKMLGLATKITGTSYKLGQVLQAEADLGVWIATMASALPVEVRA